MKQVLPDRDFALWQDSQETQKFITSSYVIKENDTYIVVPDTASGTINVTLAASKDGRKIYVVNLSQAKVIVIGDIYDFTEIRVYPNDFLFLKVVGDKYVGWSYLIFAQHVAPVATVVDSATYNVLEVIGNQNYLCDTTLTNVTLNLPTAVGNKAEITIKKIASANTLTVDAFGSQTIDDGLTAAWTHKDESVTIYSDGINWRIK
jgi:hypothetical protein